MVFSVDEVDVEVPEGLLFVVVVVVVVELVLPDETGEVLIVFPDVDEVDVEVLEG